ncbi:MAG: RluA family pseudouridine synthase [Oscillospiraceae bacterium]|nr:RluA family pseudouridine synthase [Oscillospiraceae bacterium]
MDILFQDSHIVVCIKPPRVLSTDEPGGMPALLRQALGDENADVRTVHRLDRVVSGLMVLARNPKAASNLSAQIREGVFGKDYFAVVHGDSLPPAGTLTDLLYRDKARKMTFVTQTPGKGVQEAILHYKVRASKKGLSMVEVELVTGRTHQIRVQFSSRGYPLVGERKYATLEDDCDIALWSCKLCFNHPATGEKMEFSAPPPAAYPWSSF